MSNSLRIVFLLCALALIAILIMRVSVGVWTTTNWLMLAISALVCVLVFKCFVFVFNFSYALASFLNGSLIALSGQNLVGYLLGGLMAAYGLRLFVFSWNRTRGSAYAERMARIRAEHAGMPVVIQALLWLQCTVIYTFHLFGLYIATEQGILTLAVQAGAGFILLGLVLEAVADMQKQSAKNVRPEAFVNSGLYARWRHPNFVGEIVVQLGIIIVGISAVTTTWGNLAAVLITPVYIVLLMVHQSLYADRNMLEKYGKQSAFQAYLNNSGGLLPRL